MEYSVRFHARTLGLAFRRSLLLNDRGLSIPKRGAVVVSVKSTPSAPQHPRDKDAIAAIEPGDFIVAVNGQHSHMLCTPHSLTSLSLNAATSPSPHTQANVWCSETTLKCAR